MMTDSLCDSSLTRVWVTSVSEVGKNKRGNLCVAPTGDVPSCHSFYELLKQNVNFCSHVHIFLSQLSMMTDSYPTNVWLVVPVASACANVTERERDDLLAVAEVVVLAAIFVMASLGNVLVLVALLRRRRRRNPLHQFMLNLCVADLVVALFQVKRTRAHKLECTHILTQPLLSLLFPYEVLPQLVWDAKGHLPGPDFLCRLVKYLQVLGMFASSYMIVAMTMDRHYAICFPLQAHRSSATQQWNNFIVLAWGLSLLLSVPQVGDSDQREFRPQASLPLNHRSISDELWLREGGRVSGSGFFSA